MISKMRRRVRLIMFIVAVAFVAGFLLDEVWRLLRGQTETSPLQRGILGKVGKKVITRDDYINTFNYFMVKRQREQKIRELSEEEREELANQVWQYLIQEKQWEDILKKSKITVNDVEVFEIMKANPPEELKTNPNLMTDGKFDQQKYLDALTRPENRPYFAFYARELFDLLPKEKFRIELNSSYRVPKPEIEDELSRENTRIKASFITISSWTFKEEYTPNDEELKDYYEKHKKEYEIPEQRKIKYVFFNRTITAEDSSEAKRTIDDVHNLAKTGEDFASLIRDFSKHPQETTGVWYLKSQLDKTTQNIIDSLKISDTISQPFLTSDGWQIVKVEEQKKESVKLKRIVVRIELSASTINSIEDSIQRFIQEASTVNFDSAAKLFRLTPNQTRMTKGRPFNPLGVENLGQFDEFVYKSKPKAISRPFKARNGYYVVQLDSIFVSSVQPLDKIKEVITWKIRQERQKANMKNFAQEVFNKISSGKSLDAIGQEDTSIKVMTEEFPSFTQCRNTRGPEFCGALYALKPKETSGLVLTDWAAYIIRCDERQDGAVPVNREEFQKRRSEEVLNRFFGELFKTPKIIDYREAFYY